MSARVMAALFSRAAAPRIPLPKTVTTPAAPTCQLIAVRTYKTTAPMLEKISGFTAAGLKKNWSAIPMVVICFMVVIGVPAVSFIIAKTRPDVCFHKNWGTLGDRMDLENAPYLKALELEKINHNIPQVAELYREMNKQE